MAALTDAFTLAVAEAKLVEAKLAVSTELQEGSVTLLNRATGLAVLGTNAARRSFLGLSTKNQQSDSSGNDITEYTNGGFVTGVFPSRASIFPDRYKVIRSCPVAGAASAADNWGLVYLGNTDNPSDFTLTRPSSNAVPVGIIWEYVSTNVADVMLFSPEVWAAISLAGGTKYTVKTLIDLVDFPTGGTTTLKMWRSGRIVGGRTRAVQVTATAGASSTLQVAGLDAAGVAQNAYTSPDTISLADVDTVGKVTELGAMNNNPFVHDGGDITLTITDGGTVFATKHLIELEIDLVAIAET